jgi:peptide deformylase
MAVKPVYNCFHEVLNKPTKKIDAINGQIAQLAKDLIDTLRSISTGVGLAGNQIGAEESILLIDVSQIDEYKNSKPILMINPEILEFSDKTIEMQEGCLSVPDFYEQVVRAKNIKVRYWDLKEQEHIEDMNEYIARVVQHEIDHLNGILFYQRLTPLKKTLAKNKLNKIKKGVILPDYPYVLPNGKLINA